MQDDIARAAHTNLYSEETIQKQKKLLYSREAKLVAFRRVITNKGGKTPGNDRVVFTKNDLPYVFGQLSNFRTYKCGRVRRV